MLKARLLHMLLKHHPMEQSKERNRVLVIEDDTDLCAVMQIMLKNFKVDTVHTIKEAITYLQTHHPGTIFLDNNLPDGTGIQCLSLIRHKNKSAAIVMMTAQASPVIETTALKAGANVFLPKPFSGSDIRHIMGK